MARTMTIRWRLDEFYRQLRLLPRASNADDALRKLSATLDEVEDEWSGIKKETPAPPPSRFSGRMYPPQSDFTNRMSDGSLISFTRGHRIEISNDGTVKFVCKITGKVEFEK